MRIDVGPVNLHCLGVLHDLEKGFFKFIFLRITRLIREGTLKLINFTIGLSGIEYGGLISNNVYRWFENANFTFAKWVE